MIDESYNATKNDFITALRIVYREGLSDAFAHLSARSNDGQEMMFMPRKSPALVQSDELFFGQHEEVAVFDSRPTHLRDCFDVMTCDRRRKPPIDAFVE